ncbi:MAG: glycosyltransferase family 2 protein [Acidobacteriota bacterium]
MSNSAVQKQVAQGRKPKIAIVIPALNEEQSIGRVLNELPKGLVDQVIVADNGSTDRTAEVAREHGAEVVIEPLRGYGAACLRALCQVKPDTDIIAFLDGDYSDYPEDLAMIVEPIMAGRADMVIGSRARGEREQGALTPQQIFGNWLATRLIKLIWGFNYTDLGPFRAIQADKLQELRMCDANFGWTVEMQIKALKHQLRIEEVPVRYRRRIGKSKVSGTLSGSMKAGVKILYLIAKYGITPNLSNDHQ